MKKKINILIGVIIVTILIIILLWPKKQPVSKTPSVVEQNILIKPSIPEELQSDNSDYEYGQVLKEIHLEYPWYSKLPIETVDYRIVFDFDSQKFRIRLLTPSSDQKKQSAIDEIKDIGANIDQYPYYFIEQ